jgi:hypothetical protein
MRQSCECQRARPRPKRKPSLDSGWRRSKRGSSAFEQRRRAQDNHSRSATPWRFATGMSCWELFGAYVDATKPKAGTVNRWRAVFNSLQAIFPTTSASALTEADARAWKDTLVTPKRSAVTVDAVWLSSANIVFSWALKQKHVRANPFVGVKIDVPKVSALRETKAFKPEEAQVILRASTAIANLRDAFPPSKSSERYGTFLSLGLSPLPPRVARCNLCTLARRLQTWHKPRKPDHKRRLPPLQRC